MKPWSALFAAGILAACQSGGLGRLPREVVELYDEALPSGSMEIEAERDGTIIEAEADIPVANLPPAVLEAAKAQLPGGRVTGAEREVVAGRSGYEVKMTARGRAYEFVFTPEGELLEKEVELRRSDAPATVVRNGLDAVPGSTFKSVEKIERLDVTLYHVKVRRDGASYKIELSETGEVLRRVREQRLELEIPLR